MARLAGFPAYESEGAAGVVRRGDLVAVACRCGTEGADVAASGTAVGRVKKHCVRRSGVGADLGPPVISGRPVRRMDTSGPRSTRHLQKRRFE
jgi:hypothetical protein